MEQTSDCRATVIIVNWNGKTLLADTLYALQAQTHQSFHTILVDNGSSDGSIEFVNQEFPHIETIALDWNSGFAYANNIAIKRNGTPYTILLNNDAVPAPTWIECLIKALDFNPQAGFAASKMLYFDNPALIDRVGDSYTYAGVGQLRGRKEPSNCFSEPEWIFGACAGAAIYRTTALKTAGFFDEDFFLINEDVDLSFRLQLLGHKCLFVPDAIVFHKASSSIIHDSAMSVYFGHRNMEWVYLKNLPWRLIVKTLPLHIVYNVLAFLFFMRKKHGKTYLRAKIDAFMSLNILMKKRKKIQSEMKVSQDYLWSIMGKEDFIERLKIRRTA